MESIVAFVAGIVHKLYDDLNDNEIKLSPVIDETIKVVMTCLMTILFIQNPTTSAFFMIVVLIYWYHGKIDCVFWKACVPIPIITTLINYDKFIFSGYNDLLQRIVFIVVIGGVMLVEDGLFPEETSFNKTATRIFLVIAQLIVIFLTRNFSAKGFIHSILFFLTGYMVSNIAFHTITPHLPKNQIPKQQESLDKKTDKDQP